MKKSLFRLLSIILPFILAASVNQGVEFLHMDKFVGKTVNGHKVQVLTGNVYMRQDTIDMYCDQATYYEHEQRIDFSGHVLIDDGRREIRASRIDYYTDTRLAICIDSVTIRSKKDSMAADYFTYNFTSKKATASGNVFIWNRDNLTRLWGQAGFYDPELKHSQMKNSARFERVDSISTDTLTITANELNYYDDEQPRAIAVDSVEILQGKLRAVCDSAVYFRKDEFAELWFNPRAWYEDSRMSGEEMVVYFDSLKLNKIELQGQAQAISLADSLSGNENILKGRKIDFFIKDNNPELIIARDNASSVYYLEGDSGQSGQGANFATADTIQIYFKEGELDSIKIHGGAQGTYYPEGYKGEMKFD